jgi:hypothetical protein
MNPNSSKYACNSIQIEPFEYTVFVRRAELPSANLLLLKTCFYLGINQEPNSQTCVITEMSKCECFLEKFEKVRNSNKFYFLKRKQFIKTEHIYHPMI